MKTERIRAEVYVTLRYDSAEARKAALQELRRDLGLCIHSIGSDGNYTVQTGRVIAPKNTNPSPAGRT